MALNFNRPNGRVQDIPPQDHHSRRAPHPGRQCDNCPGDYRMGGTGHQVADGDLFSDYCMFWADTVAAYANII